MVEKYKWKRNIFNSDIILTTQEYNNLYTYLSDEYKINLDYICNEHKTVVINVNIIEIDKIEESTRIKKMIKK